MGAPRHRALAALAVLCSACGGSAQTPDTPEVPNVVVVTLDTVRADRLGCYGYFRDTTPNLDRLAEESLVFEACRAPVAQTLPTHTSLFTGLTPREHGIRTNISQARWILALPDSIDSIATTLAANGYATAAFVSAEPVKSESGLAAGFQTWHEPEGKRARAADTVDRALAWLASAGERPFFLWVHLFDPHAPYRPPPPYDTLFETDAALTAYLEERDFADYGAESLAATVEAFNNAYDGEIRYTDDQLGRLVDRLRAPGLWERTVVVVTSDHGESVGQHGKMAHGDLWMEQLHVPLIVRSPGAAPGRVATPLTARDVLPTVFGLHPEIPAGAFLEQSSGADVLAGPASPRATFAELPASRGHGAHAITLDGWRLVTGDPDREALFHLREDPHELVNLIGQRPDEERALRAKLAEVLAEQAAVRQRYGGPREVKASRERVEALEALGYVDGD